MSDVLLKRDGPVAHITLNRPDKGNAFNQSMADALLAAANAVAHDPAVRVVVLTGAGRMFCVGGDIGEFAQNSDRIAGFLASLAGTLHQALAQFAAMRKPLITLVNGPAAGAGMSLAIAGDIVLACAQAHFTAAYGGIGLTPDGGMTWTLPRLVGLRKAQDILITNRRVGAEEAATIGLVTRLVGADELGSAGRELAAQLATQAVGALAQARWLLQTGMSEGFVTHMDRELQTIGAAGEGREGREGVAAFLARRKPDFQGGQNNG
ncbi:enoyl-CoA hydratase [Agrobacterium tumefaciens]|uniref:enoyl-CoA hydratase/isomerase family protein n=1 Tax=Agrobacterium tumefaciens TaxID=358 RepID=UPI0015720DB6|nr:enoyl-CoA hydratase-related protein [Agrobacterium tumefaciens]NTE68201.1 enoyl-CoA hydratase [Agrobacterium tumefaciens]